MASMNMLIPDGTDLTPGLAFENDLTLGISRGANTGRLHLNGGTKGIFFNGPTFNGVIGARMYKDTTTSLSSSGGTAAIAYNKVRYQDADFVTGSSFKCPYDGYYRLAARFAFASQTFTSAGQITIKLFKNDSTTVAQQLTYKINAGDVLPGNFQLDAVEKASANTTYFIEATAVATAAVVLASSSGTLLCNQDFEIHRIG